jgi:protein-disulfide isomerase
MGSAEEPMTKRKWLLWGGLGAAALVLGALAAAGVGRARALLNWAQCQELRDSDQARLVSYVQKEYKPFATVLPRIADISFVGSTCYRKLAFESSDQRRRIDLYLSPDLRFLSRDLSDSTVDPAKVGGDIPDALLSHGTFPSLGPAGPPATLTVFSDFECPYCARLYTMLKESVLPAEKGNVRLVFRYLPLPMHPWARAAAEAAACAQEQKDEYFWSLHDYIIEHQRELTPDNLIEKLAAAAKGLPGFDGAKFQACVAGRKTAARVNQDMAFAKQYGIQATPTLFVNGKRLESVVGAEQILTFIRQLSSPARTVAEAARR